MKSIIAVMGLLSFVGMFVGTALAMFLAEEIAPLIFFASFLIFVFSIIMENRMTE